MQFSNIYSGCAKGPITSVTKPRNNESLLIQAIVYCPQIYSCSYIVVLPSLHKQSSGKVTKGLAYCRHTDQEINLHVELYANTKPVARPRLPTWELFAYCIQGRRSNNGCDDSYVLWCSSSSSQLC